MKTHTYIAALILTMSASAHDLHQHDFDRMHRHSHYLENPLAQWPDISPPQEIRPAPLHPLNVYPAYPTYDQPYAPPWWEVKPDYGDYEF